MLIRCHSALAFVSCFTLFAAGCGGSTTVDTPPDNDTGGVDTSTSDGLPGDGPGDETTDSSVPDAPGDVVDDVGGDAGGKDARPDALSCGSEATRPLCTKCCGDAFPDGRKTFETAIIACACSASICKTECATTACASPPVKADAPCQACLVSTVTSPGDAGTDAGLVGACIDPIKSACTSAGCKAYVACLGTCPPAK
jgi:hypothetical protein